MNAVRRRTLIALSAVFLIPAAASAESLKVAVLDFWDAGLQTTDTRADIIKWADEIRSAASADERFSLVERDVTGDILKEWLGMYAFGEVPPKTGAMAGADRYLFSSAEQTSSGWVLRFRVVEYPSGRIVSAFVEPITSLRDAKARRAVVVAVVAALAEKMSSPELVIAVGSFENATRYPLLDKPAAQFRDLLEQAFSGEKGVRLLERARTDRLVEEMRLMEMGGDLSRGFDTHGMAGIFLIRGSVTLGTGAVRTSDMNVRLSVDATEIDRASVRKLFEGQVPTQNLRPAAEEVRSSFMSMLGVQGESKEESTREAELHLEKALVLAEEVNIQGRLRPRARAYLPQASIIGHRSLGRKEILQAAIHEAENALFLNPKLDEAWFIRALCLRTDQIARYDEALDILLELSKRPTLDADMRIKVMSKIANVPAYFVKHGQPPGRHVKAAERAMEELVRIDKDTRRVWRAENLLRMAIHRWKDPKKAFDRGRQLLECYETYKSIELDGKRISRFGSVVQTYLDISRIPGVDFRDVLAGVLPYAKTARPEESLALWTEIGLFHQKAGRLEEAASALDGALKSFRTVIAREEIMDEKYVYEIGFKAVHYQVETLQKMDRYDPAILVGEEFLKFPDANLLNKYPRLVSNRNIGAIRYMLGQMYESRHGYAQALVLYEEADRTKFKPSRGNIKSDIRRVRARLKIRAPFPLRKIPFNDAGLPREPVTAIVSENGKIWASLFPGAERGAPYFLFSNPPEPGPGGGLYVYENSAGWSPVRPPGILSDIPVTSLCISAGRLWVGTYGGGVAAHDLTTGEWRVFKEDQGLPMNHVLCLYPDGNRIWIGFGDMSRGGIGWIDVHHMSIASFTSERRKMNIKAGPPAAPVTAITRLNDVMYAAEYQVGIKCFGRYSENPAFRIIFHQRTDTGHLVVPDIRNRVAALTTHDKKVWIGCFTAGSRLTTGKDRANGGIGWLDEEGGARAYFEEQGLPTNSVTSIALFKGLLVAGTNEFGDEGGLAVYDEAADRWIGAGGFRVLSLHADGDKLYVGTSDGIKVYGR